MLHLSRILAPGLAESPTKPALCSRKTSLSFEALERVTNGLARALAQRGVGRGDRVLVLAEKSPATVATAIALWKLGAVYVPVDVDNPAERLAGIVARVMPVLACVPTAAGRFAGETSIAQCPTFQLGELVDYARDGGLVSVTTSLDDLAYILHTSGTTGEPKGAAISHRAVASFLTHYGAYLGMGSRTSVLNIGPFHFDVTFQDAFLPLFVGGTTYVCEGLIVPSVIFRRLREQHVTHFFAVASVLTLLTRKEMLASASLPSLEVLVTGAEVCDPDVLRAWRDVRPGLRIINSYGPTEANSVSIVHQIESDTLPRGEFHPIGRPLPSVRACHVDSDLAPITAVDVTGELLLGGPQLMEGYFTPEGFDRGRIVRLGDIDYYRTGDLVTRDAAGDYRFRGRADREVKLAGRRINLLEVERALVALPGVELAITDVFAAGASKTIVAVVVVSDVAAVDTDAWGARLREVLPEYLCPVHVGVTSGEVRASNGKIDRRRLLGRLSQALESGRAPWLRLEPEVVRTDIVRTSEA